MLPFGIQYVIEVEDFTKTFGRHDIPAVNDVSFTVKDGEILGFAGLNGAGKTTTIRAMCGIILPSAGSITVDGHNIVSDKIRASRTIGWVPEFPNFDPNAKAIPLLMYYAGFYGIKGEKAKTLAKELMEKVDLSSALNKKLRTYSQGMKKRFALASSMISDPQNFLFDETLNGLDPEGINYLRKLMLKLKEEGKSVFLSSHILSELENLADRIMIIHKGEIIETLAKDRMRSLGKPVLKLRLNKTDQKVIGMLEKYGTVKVEGDTITVMNLPAGEETTDDINAELIKNGYRVSMFNIQGASLEEYFVQLVGKNR